MALDTAHATQHNERAHRGTGAEWPETPHTQHNTPSGHTGEQEPSSPGHRTRNTTHQAVTPVNRNQVAKHIAKAKQRTSGHTSERDSGDPRHRTRNTTNQAGTPVNRSQVAHDTAHAQQRTELAHR